MKFIRILLHFHRPLWFPSLMLAGFLGFLISFPNFHQGGRIFLGTALAIVPVYLMMHYFYYELRYKEQYLFYRNTGLTGLQLWISSVLFSFINAFLLALV